MNTPRSEAGNILPGVAVTPTKFQAVTSLQALENNGLMRPSIASNATKAQISADPTSAKILGLAKALHDAVQRPFDKARKTRALSYAGYIEATEVNKQLGGVPAITLWSEHELCAAANGSGVVIPFNTILIAIDGETQTEARFILAEKLPETRAQPLAVTLYHGIPTSGASQVVHDYNVFSTPIAENKAALLSHTGPISKLVESSIQAVGLSRLNINRSGSLPNQSTKVSSDQMFYAACGLACGSAMQDVKVTPSRLKEWNRVGAMQVLPAAITGHLALLTCALNTPIALTSHPLVWQCAGVTLAKGRSADSLQWAAGRAAHLRAKIGKAKPVEMLASILAAL